MAENRMDIGNVLCCQRYSSCNYNDTGEKFAIGVNDTGGKIAAGINDTRGKFATGINDTGGKFFCLINKTGTYHIKAIEYPFNFF